MTLRTSLKDQFPATRVLRPYGCTTAGATRRSGVPRFEPRGWERPPIDRQPALYPGTYEPYRGGDSSAMAAKEALVPATESGRRSLPSLHEDQ
jgi:hypothetical protein